MARQAGGQRGLLETDQLQHRREHIDEGHRLVGILRREWRGFTGGDEVQKALDQFFAELVARAEGGGA